jgi:hypothetical protein
VVVVVEIVAVVLYRGSIDVVLVIAVIEGGISDIVVNVVIMKWWL